jgi:tRNA (mo5U34)-methyltransferase
MRRDRVVREPPSRLSIEERRAIVASFPFWYQRIYLGDGVWTRAGRALHEQVWDRAARALPADLAGRSVLDVGSNAGYFSLQAKLRGAGRVVGIELVDMFLQQAEHVRQIWDLDVEYRRQDVHALDGGREIFDLVIFAGVLYHLKNPLQVLETMGRLCHDAIVIETEVIPDDPRNTVVVRLGSPPILQPCSRGIMKFIEGDELNGDGSNWWVPDTACVMSMLRTAGFVRISRPVLLAETRLCLVASKRETSMLDFHAFDA